MSMEMPGQSGPVVQEIAGDVLILRLSAPPVNVLDPRLRAALAAAIASAQDHAGLRAIVIAGAGRFFSAGVDLREQDAPVAAGSISLRSLCDRIEASRVPVVAVLEGPALGGGAEIALAAHYRIGGPGARIGFPEIALGLIPDAGGTQRLSRIAGSGAALNMLASGRPVVAAVAERMGLLDAVAPDDPVAAAIAFGEGMADEGLGPRPASGRRDRVQDGAAWMAAVAARRAGFDAQTPPAQRAVVDCVEAALLLPWHAAMVFEAETAALVRADGQGRALRHLFGAERRIARSLMRREGAVAVLTDEGEALATTLGTAFGRAAAALVRLGMTPADIDAALVAQGFPVGPFGGTGEDAGPAPGTDDSLAIMTRVLAAVVAEGTRLLATGAVARAGDVDALAVAGLGWPRTTGGPMRMAHDGGLLRLTQAMAGWADEDPIWEVPPLMQRAALQKAGFDAA
jgi:3-hydroxyacyl-CoA dehydrogenase